MRFARLSAVIGAVLFASAMPHVLGETFGDQQAHPAAAALAAIASHGKRPAASTVHSDATDMTSLDPTAYPWPGVGPHTSSVDGHGYFAGECTSFAAWAIRHDGRRHDKSPDFLGNADQWTGAAIDPEPHAGDIAQWDPWRSRSLGRGHVAYVAAIGPHGSIEIYEYNWVVLHGLSTAWIPADTVTRFLRF